MAQSYFISFFVGKTLLCKERAIRLAARDGRKNVFYVSMVGSFKNGTPRKERFLFDAYTRNFEMKFTDAHPIDIPNLIDYYDQHHPMFEIFYDTKERKNNRRLKKKPRLGNEPYCSDVDSYDLVKFFIQHSVSQHENSHFILDEVPIFQRKGNYIWLTQQEWWFYQ